MASRRNYTQATLENIRRRMESGASVSQDDARALREADNIGASGRSTGGIASVRRNGRIETPGAAASRVVNGPRRNDPRSSGGVDPLRVHGSRRDVLNEVKETRGGKSPHPGGFPGGQGMPADASTPEPPSPGGGRKRTRLPTDSDGINETRYMREAREKMQTPVQDKLRRAEQLLEGLKGTDKYDAYKARVDAMREKYGSVPEGASLPSGYGRAMTKNGSFAFHSDGKGGLRSGLPRWNEDAARRAEADRRRRIMDSIDSNRREGLAAGARVLGNFDKFAGDMDQVALGKKNPVEAVQTMKDIMRDAQTNVGMTDRKFSSGQGFSEKNRQKLDDFAGTLVDKAIESAKAGIDKTYRHEQSAEAKALGDAIGRVDYETTSGRDQANVAELNILSSKPGQSNVNDAAAIVGHATDLARETKALTQATKAYNEKNKADRAANDKYFAEVQADIDKAKFALGREASPRVGPVGPVDQNGKSQQENRLHQEMIQRQNELWKKKQQGQADWGGGISDRARRFIDRRRSETSGALARFLAGREVA